MNPLTNIINDRAEARKQGDSNADTCFLALADQDGKASVRTLVLREVTESHLEDLLRGEGTRSSKAQSSLLGVF